MAREFTLAELESYLDETLSAELTADLEAELRDNKELVKRLRQIQGRRDAGVHSLGDIWRRNRTSCADRETLGSYLLAILPPEHQSYLKFHIEEIGCRFCQANLADLQQRQSSATEAETRQRRYFQSSAGFFKPDA